MTKKNISTGISLPRELFEKIELLRGDVSRSRFVSKLLKKALEVPPSSLEK